MTELTYPTPAQIAAALETLLDTAQRAYDQADRQDKDERAFWRRQRNAYINAQADVLAGRLPLVSGEAYLVPSASRPGSYHRCWREGGVWLCSCECGEAGQFHRHTALISGIEYAIDLVEQGLIGEQGGGEIPEETPPDDFSDVGPVEPRQRLDDPARVASLVHRLTTARAHRLEAA